MTTQHLNAIDHFPYIHNSDVTLNLRRTRRYKNKQKKAAILYKKIIQAV